MKRGVTDITGMQTVMIIITVILLAFFLPRLYETGEVLINPTKYPTLASLKELQGAIDDLVISPQRHAIEAFPIGIEAGKTIVGFSRGASSVRDKCSALYIPKPVECGDSSCICAYTDLTSSPQRCVQLSRVRSITSLELVEGPLNVDTAIPDQVLRQFLSVDDFKEVAYYPFDEGDEHALHATGWRVSGIGGFPQHQADFVLHYSCDILPVRDFSSGALYLELQQSGEYHDLLITPTTSYTRDRFRIGTRGLPMNEAEERIKRALLQPDCEEGQDTFCFDAQEVRDIYTSTRRLHPEGKFSDSIWLLAFGDRLRSAGILEPTIYEDYIRWNPQGEGLSEAYYHLAKAQYPPQSIRLQQQNILDSIKPRLEMSIDYLTQAIAKGKSGDTYAEHAYFLRGLYHIALGDMQAAQQDIQRYASMKERRAYYQEYSFDYWVDHYTYPRYDLEEGLVSLEDTTDYVLSAAPPTYLVEYQELSKQMVDTYKFYQANAADFMDIPLNEARDPQWVLLPDEDHYSAYHVMMSNKPPIVHFDDELATLEGKYELDLQAYLMTSKILAHRYRFNAFMAYALAHDPAYLAAHEALSTEEKAQIKAFTGYDSTQAFYQAQEATYKQRIIDWNLKLIELEGPVRSVALIDNQQLTTRPIRERGAAYDIPLSLWYTKESLPVGNIDNFFIIDYARS